MFKTDPTTFFFAFIIQKLNILVRNWLLIVVKSINVSPEIPFKFHRYFGEVTDVSETVCVMIKKFHRDDSFTSLITSLNNLSIDFADFFTGFIFRRAVIDFNINNF